MSQQVNIKDLNVPQLKALAFDLQRLANHYTSQYNGVLQELQVKEDAEQKEKSEIKVSELKAVPQKKKEKSEV